MKLLVIEDDRETAAYLVKGLSESGYTVDHSGEGREGLFLATSGSYDAIVRDRMLPGMDCETRRQGHRTPAARVSAPRIPDAQRRSCRDPHDAAGKCVGLPFRSADERDRRACQPAAAKDRQAVRAPAAAHGARCRVLLARR